MGYKRRNINLDIREDNFKPIFSKESLTYYRDEKEGYATFSSSYLPHLREVVINPLANYILSICDGNRSIRDICGHLSEHYPKVEYEKICADVGNILFQYSRMGILSWKEGYPFMNKHEVEINERYKIVSVDETQIRQLRDFIKEKHGNEINYCNPYSSFGSYDELKLRSDLFSYTEEYFFLLKDNEIVGLISYVIPINYISTASNIGLVICNNDDLSNIIKYSIELLKELSIKKLTKIIFFGEDNIKTVNLFDEILKESGYKKEAVLEKEIDNLDIFRMCNLIV